MKLIRRVREWRRRRHMKWLWKHADQPMSCHCYSSYHGQITFPKTHQSWCPAGKTVREFALGDRSGEGEK